MPQERIGAGYIVVEGPIGVGKTTLARRLAARLRGDLLLERPFDNPFLARFYENPSAWALSAQLSFLLQRAEQVAALRQADLFRRVHVADFMLEKDRLFARLNLAYDELALYEQVYARVIDDVPRPDWLIYLQAPVPVLRERIARRAVAYELAMPVDYLPRLVDAYTRYFSDAGPETAGTTLIVNAADCDFLHREDHFLHLVERLDRAEPGVCYFDPPAIV